VIRPGRLARADTRQPLMTIGLLDIAVPLPPQDFSLRHVWTVLPLLYYAGLWRAKRRYE
jgi:hypothetical protein